MWFISVLFIAFLFYLGYRGKKAMDCMDVDTIEELHLNPCADCAYYDSDSGMCTYGGMYCVNDDYQP